ncbi:peroxide stress protein YaaA [Neptunicoccus sediminis]|uniref:peroxide stress protein YaaA n=1 Tax=Neptunicoccus sediminis TaxID=1892596 RepID=UPI000846174C|nr:peroxide stress protein YaaA [Neptunicoccus sediminis]
MLAVLSPAKKLNFDRPAEPMPETYPEFQEDANRLAAIAQRLSVSDLRSLMHISEDLAKLNKARFDGFAAQSSVENAKQAMFAFAGDTYTGLEATGFDPSDCLYAQDHLRILSGLYGLLRPMDLIQPYRLEMGSRLNNDAGTTLYAYWGERLCTALDAASNGAPVVNLASNEYFKAAKEKKMTSPVITPSFKEDRNGELKMIGFFAKRARGAMARYIIKNRVKTVDGLKDFDLDGYKFQPSLSTENALTFTRSAA